MTARTRLARKLLAGSLSGALVAMVVLAGSVPAAYADPFLISLQAPNGGISSIQSTVTAVGETPDGRQLFDIVIHEQWESLAPGVLTFSNFPERAILDITKMASNGTGETWTSFDTVTRAENTNVPPFAILFEAIENGFFSNEANWQLTTVQMERCQQLFPTICNQPFYGNLFTFLNGRVAPAATVRIRFAVQLDRGDFTLTQTPNNAVVPEPSTFVLFGTAAAAAWRTRRKRMPRAS